MHYYYKKRIENQNDFVKPIINNRKISIYITIQTMEN